MLYIIEPIVNAAGRAFKKFSRGVGLMFLPQEKQKLNKTKTKGHKDTFGGEEYVYDLDYGDGIRVFFVFVFFRPC